MQIVRDLLRADREGIWKLHLDAVQRALYLFAAFDSINYLRCDSLYLEDMRLLPKLAPSVYKHFSQGILLHVDDCAKNGYQHCTVSHGVI